MSKKPTRLDAHKQWAEGIPGLKRQAAILYSTHEVSRLITQYFDRAMKQYGITHSQWWTLMHILENEGISQKELADKLQHGKASTGKILERMEASGWIRRQKDRTDSRVRRLFLTDRALDLVAPMSTESQQLFGIYMKGITEEEQELLLRLLEKMKDNDTQSGGPDPTPGPAGQS